MTRRATGSPDKLRVALAERDVARHERDVAYRDLGNLRDAVTRLRSSLYEAAEVADKHAKALRRLSRPGGSGGENE